MSPKRILIFSTAYYPFVGGAEVAVKEITDRISDNFEFDLITAKMDKNLPSTEKVGKINVYRIGFGKPLLDKLLLPLRGAILAWKLNNTGSYVCFWGIMVTFGSGAGYICNIFRSIFGKKKIPMVLTLQEGDSENYLQYKWGGLIALSWKLALWKTDLLTGISNFLLNRTKRNGYTRDSVLIPNGVDIDLFSRKIDSKVKDDMINRLGKGQDDIFLVTSGRLVHKNGVDDIISALSHLPKKVSLVIIGKGILGQNLQKQANNLGLSDRVKFLGFISYEDMPKYLSVCDIFVRPSRSEGFGNSFIEAMAAKLPVIATPVGGIPDFIDDKETGVFCSPNNPKSVSEAVRLLIEDDKLTEHIILNAYKRVSEKYSWNYIAKDIEERVFNKYTK